MRRKQTILITLHSRFLTEGEAANLRAFVVTLKPKIYCVMADWPWIEVRGISEQAARQIVERVRAIVPRCSVAGLDTGQRRQMSVVNVMTDGTQATRRANERTKQYALLFNQEL